MEARVTRKQPDSLLLPFLQAAEEAASDRHLARLIQEHAEPIIRRIVWRKEGLSPHGAGGRTQSQDEQDAEDIHQEAVLQLVARLRECRADPDREAIGDLRAYAAVTAYRACDRHLRRKYPQRWSLKSRLRYLLENRTDQRGFALWESDSGERLCGFAAWRALKTPNVHSARLQQFLAAPQTVAQTALPREDAARMNPAALLAALFQWVDHPVALDDLVSVVAALWGVKDSVTPLSSREDEETESPHERLPDPRADVAAEAEQRAFLHHLWTEVRQLPPRQCAALLLNLRDSQGRGIIALFPITGIATLRQIADALAMPAERFAEIWNDLPLEDAAIAQHFGLTRQQVINLRKVARERLARRMRAHDSEV